MSDTSKVRQIIAKAGGVTAIADAIDGITKEAVYKWPKIGIPDRHWPALITLTGVTADDLLSANIEARELHADKTAAD